MQTINHQPPTTNRAARRWLLLGVVAVAVAGLYSLTLVLGRAPVFSNNPEIQRIFKDALVVHVDLSVLVWFLAIACLLWSLASQGARSVVPYVEEAAQVCFALAIVLMMLSPFMPGAAPLMSNYIPMISTPIFMLALGLLLCGVGFMLFKGVAQTNQPPTTNHQPPTAYGITSAAWITVIAIACFVWSYHLMPPVIEGEQYFDMLFWGGGHVLQLTHAQVLMVVWVIAWEAIGIRQQALGIREESLSNPQCLMPNAWLYVLFSIGLVSALISPLAYFLYDVESFGFRQFFTHKMIMLDGLAPGILALVLLWKLLRSPSRSALWSCALVSVLLFLYGGALGLMIRGQNVVIPAHYHGSIVGITLAFMGFAYLMLPRLGWRDVSGWRMAFWQPIVYGIGQVMHVSGLAYSGGYGVLRKTAGGVDALPLNIKIALGVMGAGGVLAIAGGLLFVVVVVRAMSPLPRAGEG